MPFSLSRPNWVLIFFTLTLVGCQSTKNSEFNASELGKSFTINFGQVVSVREVPIGYHESGKGIVIGGMAGIAGGSVVGSGGGNVLSVLVATAFGMALGSTTEALLHDGRGIEYGIELDSGIKMTILQNIPKQGSVPAVGERIFVRNAKGLQRVLPLTALPAGIADPMGK